MDNKTHTLETSLSPFTFLAHSLMFFFSPGCLTLISNTSPLLGCLKLPVACLLLWVDWTPSSLDCLFGVWGFFFLVVVFCRFFSAGRRSLGSFQIFSWHWENLNTNRCTCSSCRKQRAFSFFFSLWRCTQKTHNEHCNTCTNFWLLPFLGWHSIANCSTT